jgi:hypothetical protein
MVVWKRTKRGTRRVVVAATLMALVAAPVVAEESEGETWAAGGKGAATALVNVLYIPAKLVYALVGAPVGGLAYCITAGDREVAQSVWEPSVGGSYILTTDQLFPPTSGGAVKEGEPTSPGVQESEPQWPE